MSPPTPTPLKKQKQKQKKKEREGKKEEGQKSFAPYIAGRYRCYVVRDSTAYPFMNVKDFCL